MSERSQSRAHPGNHGHIRTQGNGGSRCGGPCTTGTKNDYPCVADQYATATVWRHQQVGCDGNGEFAGNHRHRG